MESRYIRTVSFFIVSKYAYDREKNGIARSPGALRLRLFLTCSFVHTMPAFKVVLELLLPPLLTFSYYKTYNA